MNSTWQALADDPWLVFACAAFAGLGLGWWGLRTDRRRYVAAACAVLLAAVGFVSAAYFTATPRKSVEAFVHRLAAAGQNRDAAALSAALDDDYRFENRTKASLSAVIERELRNYRPDYVRATVQRVVADETQAEADFEVVTGGVYASGGLQVNVPRYFVQLKLKFAKRGADWKIVEIRRYEPHGRPPREIGLEQR